MTQYEYLKQYKEPFPKWLADYQPSDHFDSAAFMRSRVVFYPGAATDGHPIKLFGSTHSAHCFVYADYGVSKEDIISELEHPQHRVLGYNTLARIELKQEDLVPHGWKQHINYQAYLGERPWTYNEAKSYGFVEILERSEDHSENHGGKRLAILFLGADGIATYDALFCQDNGTPPPFAMLLQDHGFGGNYDHFGNGRLLHQIASRRNVFPSFMLVAENSNPWFGYTIIDGLAATKGGMHNGQRFLYTRNANY